MDNIPASPAKTANVIQTLLARHGERLTAAQDTNWHLWDGEKWVIPLRVSAPPRGHLKGAHLHHDGLDYMRRAAPIQPPEPPAPPPGLPIVEDEWPGDPFAIAEQLTGPLALIAVILIAIFAP